MAAFGTLIGTASVALNSASSSVVISGASINVSIGDLLFVTFAEQTNLTVTAITDNLGNSYTAATAGVDAGTITGRSFYSRSTKTSLLTSVTGTATSSADNVVMLLGAFAGPFEAPPVDTSPADTTADVSSPFACPASGVLGQTTELVVGWGVAGYSTAWVATAGASLAVDLNSQGVAKAAICYQVSANTSSLTPQFSAGVNPGQSVLGTVSFKLSNDVLMGQALF